VVLKKEERFTKIHEIGTNCTEALNGFRSFVEFFKSRHSVVVSALSPVHSGNLTSSESAKRHEVSCLSSYTHFWIVCLNRNRFVHAADYSLPNREVRNSQIHTASRMDEDPETR